MLLYSKLYDLLHGKLGCKIIKLYGKNNALRYVKFQTKNGTPALLYISSSQPIQCDIEKVTPIVRWEKKEISYNTILADDMTLLKEVIDYKSPDGYIKMLKRLGSSLASIIYKAAIMSSEFFSVLHKDGDVDTFAVKGEKETQLLVVIELEGILFKNIIPEIDRVYSQIQTILKDTCTTYWTSLLKLLLKCEELKIVSDGQKKMNNINLIEKTIALTASQDALKIAIECFLENN